MFVTLMYHIVDRTIRAETSISEEAFDAQLDCLDRSNYTVLSLTQAIDIVNNRQVSPDRSVLLTFDDGYATTVYSALPRLRTYGMTAALFLVSKYIGQTNWWDLRACYDTNHLAWNELTKWLDSGCEVGGHSHTHVCLTRLSEQKARQEITRNMRILKNRLGIDLKAFSYPYGEFNALVESIVADYYQIAFATDDGDWPCMKNQYAIKRIGISPTWNIAEFEDHLETLLEEANQAYK